MGCSNSSSSNIKFHPFNKVLMTSEAVDSDFDINIDLKGYCYPEELKMFGWGANGSVCEVSKERANYALKEMESHESDFETVRDFDQRIKELPAAVASCPFLVKYVAAFRNLKIQRIYIVMELCDGNFYKYIKSFDYSNGIPLKEDHLMKIMIQLLLGLLVLHDNGIVHRNIKPSNAFIVRNCAKLGDYLLKEKLDAMWKRGVGYKELFYVAPECFQGEGYDTQADLWSLGLLFFYLCTGKLTFPGKKYLGIKKGMKPPIPSDCPDHVGRMICAMLTNNPTERPTVRQLLADEYVKGFAARLHLKDYYPKDMSFTLSPPSSPSSSSSPDISFPPSPPSSPSPSLL